MLELEQMALEGQKHLDARIKAGNRLIVIRCQIALANIGGAVGQVRRAQSGNSVHKEHPVRLEETAGQKRAGA